MIEFIGKIKFIGSSDSPIPPTPDPTTVSFSAMQFATGFVGPVSSTKTPGRIYGRATRTLWLGFITGSEAKLTASTDFGDFDGIVSVAIDGGSFTYAPRDGQVFILFSGLANAAHFVEIRYTEGIGDAPFILASGDVLTVTGQPPRLAPLSNRVEVDSDSATGLYSAASLPNDPADFSPNLQAPKGEDYGSNIGSVKIRGAFKLICVTLTTQRRVGVSKNGSPAIFYSVAEESGATGAPVRAIRIPCDGSLSTYNIWDDGAVHNLGGTFAVSTDAPLQNIGTRRRLDQYGDSITFGSGPGAQSSDVETMPVAAALGFVGSTTGRSGLTIETLLVLLDTVLPRRIVSSTDIAILAIGGNNAGSGITPENQANYGLCIDKLLAKGYSRVLCRGILPPNEDPSLADPANALLRAVVTQKADPRVLWADTRSWTGYATEDGAHPTVAGYLKIGEYALRDYPALIGL